MKKVTIITPPEYDSVVLEALSKARVTQLKQVTGPGFDDLRETSERVDYATLYEKVHTRYNTLLDLSEGEVERSLPDKVVLQEFASNPQEYTEAALSELESLITQLKDAKEDNEAESNEIVEELQNLIDEENESFREAKSKLEDEHVNLEKEKADLEERLAENIAGATARLESVRALEPEQFKSCFAVGLVSDDLIPDLEVYLKRYPEVFYKAVSVTSEKSFMFIFGPEKGRKWVEALFLVFDVKDIFEVLNTRDVLLVLDPEKRDEVIKKYEEELNRIEKENADQQELEKKYDKKIDDISRRIVELENRHNQKIEELKNQYGRKLEEKEEEYSAFTRNKKEEQNQILNKISYIEFVLGTITNKDAPVLRTNVISILQGWVPDYRIPELEKAVEAVETKIEEKLFVQFEDPSHDDHNVPIPDPQIKPAILQPAWKLTTLRGWPSAHEINPSYISIIIFSFQFGLMYGDIGQGALFLIAGIIMANKYKRGLMSKLGTLFIPMGISAIIFGVMYDSIFLIEGLLFHHHQIMPNPVHETTTLLKIVFMIAAIEIIIGLILGAINQIKAGNMIGAIGEHGLGMILYVAGLYLSVMRFIEIGMDFMPVLSYWTFYLMLAGMFLSFLEPVLHSVTHGHGIGMESIGEGIGGLMMTFVEGLANMFSFLRIAAFALAHASLAIAAEALTHSLGIAGVGLIVMNVIALSFEMVSSSVQSLRLLYYEFMGKFFHGDGVPFVPFRLRRST